MFVPLIKHHYFLVGVFFIGFHGVVLLRFFLYYFSCLRLSLIIIVNYILKTLDIGTAQNLQTIFSNNSDPSLCKSSFIPFFFPFFCKVSFVLLLLNTIEFS